MEVFNHLCSILQDFNCIVHLHGPSALTELLVIVSAAAELMLNVSSAYDDYWVKTGQLLLVLFTLCLNMYACYNRYDKVCFVTYIWSRTLTQSTR